VGEIPPYFGEKEMSFNSVVAKTVTVLNNLVIKPGATLTVEGAISGTSPAPDLHVDTVTGLDAVDRGESWANPLATMAYALSLVATGGKIKFRGDVREECVGSNLVFDVTIEGCGSLHHPDLPAAGYQPGSSCWRPPASPTTATPLIKVRGRGWNFVNIFFDAPVDAAAIYLERNALSGTSEYDASHASIIGCRFVDGKWAIQDVGGCYNVTVNGCEFKAFTTAAIANTSTAVANPLNWKIFNNRFPSNVSDFGNVVHLDSPLNCAEIIGNIFGTVRSTGLYIDLTGSGGGNIVCNNVLGGVYDTSDYVPHASDLWYQNYVAVKATTAPDGLTLTVPAAP
jgi:hypothetical protein